MLEALVYFNQGLINGPLGNLKVSNYDLSSFSIAPKHFMIFVSGFHVPYHLPTLDVSSDIGT